MKFAINYSVGLESFLKDRDNVVDWIKCPDWFGLIMEARKIRPVYVHFDILVGLNKVKDLDWERISMMLNLTSTPHVNCHLVTSRQTNPSSPADVLAMMHQWEDEVTLLASRFGNNKVVIEHFPFMPYHPYMRAAVDANNIRALVDQSGCGFLLDLAHARITALNFGLDLQEYTLTLPVHRLTEMHITGIQRFNGCLHDHFMLKEEDWSYLEWVLKLMTEGQLPKPVVTSFEYGGVGETFAWRTYPQVLEEQVPRLSEMIKSC